MLELKTLLEAIRELPPDELDQVRQVIEARDLENTHQRAIEESVQAWFADLDDALTEFWQDTSADERAAIVAAMNEDNYMVEDPRLFSDLNQSNESNR